jgi:hypothetical protein
MMMGGWGTIEDGLYVPTESFGKSLTAFQKMNMIMKMKAKMKMKMAAKTEPEVKDCYSISTRCCELNKNQRSQIFTAYLESLRQICHRRLLSKRKIHICFISDNISHHGYRF